MVNNPQGHYDDTLAHQQQALQLREAVRDTNGMCESYFFIGVVYERWQQHDRAQAYYTTALQIADHHGHRFAKAGPARQLAGLAQMKGDLDQALAYALQSLLLHKEAGFKPFLPLSSLLVGGIYLAQGDITNASHQYEQAYALAKAMGQKHALISCLLSLGQIQAMQGEGELARAGVEQALALAAERQLPYAIALASSRLKSLAP